MTLPDAAGSELVRVTRPGGRIAYASWTPDSGIAAMMRVLSEYVPPEPNPSPPPVLWGDPGTVRERFGNRVEDIGFETATVMYPALSPAHFWHEMTIVSGVIMLAAEAVPDANREAMYNVVSAALSSINITYHNRRSALCKRFCDTLSNVPPCSGYDSCFSFEHKYEILTHT